MNKNERTMVALLRELREQFGLVGIKQELEVEGSRPDDLYRIKEITMAAGVPITLKIGGCEAISDLALAKLVGVGAIVAPMVESPFALKKFVGAMKTVFAEDELEDLRLLVNIETATAAKNYDDMLASPAFDSLHGIAIGRKDFAMSMGLGLTNLDDDAVVNPVRELIDKTKAKRTDLHTVVGGIGGAASLQTLAGVKGLDEFETRKMIFSASVLSKPTAVEGLRKGLEFEILWYENKAAYYRTVAGVDEGYVQRIKKNIQTL